MARATCCVLQPTTISGPASGRPTELNRKVALKVNTLNWYIPGVVLRMHIVDTVVGNRCIRQRLPCASGTSPNVGENDGKEDSASLPHWIAKEVKQALAPRQVQGV